MPSALRKQRKRWKEVSDGRVTEDCQWNHEDVHQSGSGALWIVEKSCRDHFYLRGTQPPFSCFPASVVDSGRWIIKRCDATASKIFLSEVYASVTSALKDALSKPHENRNPKKQQKSKQPKTESKKSESKQTAQTTQTKIQTNKPNKNIPNQTTFRLPQNPQTNNRATPLSSPSPGGSLWVTWFGEREHQPVLGSWTRRRAFFVVWRRTVKGKIKNETGGGPMRGGGVVNETVFRCFFLFLFFFLGGVLQYYFGVLFWSVVESLGGFFGAGGFAIQFLSVLVFWGVWSVATKPYNTFLCS